MRLKKISIGGYIDREPVLFRHDVYTDPVHSWLYYNEKFEKPQLRILYFQSDDRFRKYTDLNDVNPKRLREILIWFEQNKEKVLPKSLLLSSISV